MLRSEIEATIHTVSTLACVIDSGSTIVKDLLGVVITGTVNDTQLDSDAVVELVAARVSAHLTATVSK